MGIGAVRAALMAAAVVAFFHAVPASGNLPRAYGRELVGQFELPDDAVARYAARADAAGGERAPVIDDAMWVGPLQQVGAGRNPYMLVLTVSGAARAGGDIRAQWRAGWEVRESPLATREVLMTAAAQLDGAAVTGAAVTLTAVSAPLSFRGARQASPMVDLVHASNLDIHDVRLQVWSGSAPMLTWPALQPAWLGLGALCLLMGFLLRHTAPPVAVTSRLPHPDLQRMLGYPVNTERPSATPPVAAALAAAAAAPAPQNPTSRVVDALRDVLLHGLAVPTELDLRRRRRAG